jgi:hypothetical protein
MGSECFAKKADASCLPPKRGALKIWIHEKNGEGRMSVLTMRIRKNKAIWSQIDRRGEPRVIRIPVNCLIIIRYNRETASSPT